MKYIDIHSHVYFPDFDSDREEVISRALAAEVGIITVGTDFESSQKAVSLAASNENMWATVGLHPVDAGNSKSASFDYEMYKKLAKHPKVVAIGECGLDYFHAPFDRDKQRSVFIEHIKLANELKKPLMLHVRNAKISSAGSGDVLALNAYQEALILLNEYAKVSANFHFFAGSDVDLKDIVNAGYNVSFTGVITFTHDYDNLVKMVPLDRCMSETDCPFVSPIPYRGKRNEPTFVTEIAHKIAEIRQEEDSYVSERLVENAKKFFNI